MTARLGITSTPKTSRAHSASIAPALMDELKPLIAQKDKVKKLVFCAAETEYTQVRGFVRQSSRNKNSAARQVCLIGASEAILDVFKMTGIDKFLTVQQLLRSKAYAPHEGIPGRT